MKKVMEKRELLLSLSFIASLLLLDVSHASRQPEAGSGEGRGC